MLEQTATSPAPAVDLCMMAPITEPLPAVAATPASAIPDERAALAFHELFLKLNNPRYLLHPEFLLSWQSGYVAEGEYGSGWNTDELTYDEVVETVEHSVSRKQFMFWQRVEAADGKPFHSYAYEIGFICGWLLSLVDHGVMPHLPAAVLRKWYRVYKQMVLVADLLGVERHG